MIIYQREFEQFNFTTESTLATSKIILSTNLAGRGTDIKLSDDLLEAGGLHVIVTFLPENSRIEDQAYGRAARCGNPGSGQIIAFIKNDSQEVPSVFQLKEFRNNKEVHRIKSLKNFYKFHTEIEEICLNQFRIHCSKAMESVTQFSSNGEEKLPTLEQIIYFSLLDEWALWLDTKSPLIRQCAKNCDESEKTAIIDSVKQFLVHHPVTPTNTALQWIQSPHSLLTATLIYIHGNNLEAAKNLLDRVVNEFPEFSGEAFYYRAVLQQWQIRSAKELPKDPKILQGLFAGDNKKVESSETEVTVEASNPVAKYFNNYCKTQISRIKKGNEKFGKGEFINGTWEYAKFTMDSMSYSIAGHLGTGVREIGKGSVNLVNLGLGWLSKQGNSIIKDINPDYIIDSLINIDELKVLETQEFFHHARYHFELKNIRRDEAATIVRRLQDIDKSQTVKVNGFEEQTIQIKRLVNGIISNIDDMVGSVIDIKTFEFDNNRLKAYKRFKHLERLGYISPPLLCLQELPCQLNVFKEKYFISRKVLQKMLHFARTFKYRVEYHGRAILSEDILADYLPLPSRKEFWTDLSRKGCFSEEIKCFKIDPTRKHLISFQRNLQNFNFKKYSDKFNLCITLTNSNFMESEVAKSYCTAACILNLLKNKKIDEDELQYLIEEEIIIPDIFGIINKEKFLSLNYLEKFDGITVNGLADFLEVSEAFSITVIQQLVDADILLPTFCSMTSMNISFEPKETIVAGICLSKELMQRFKDYSYLENISCDVVQCVFGLKTLEEVITVTSHLIKEEILKPFEKEIYVLQPSVDIDCSILSACIRDDVEAFLLHCSSYTLAYYSLRENILSTKPQHKIIILPLDPYKNLHNDFVKYGLIMPQRFERNEEMFVDYDCTDNPTKMKEIVKEHSTMLTEKKAALQSTQDYLVKKEITLPLDVRKTVINSLREIATISSNASLWWLWLAVGAILAMIIIIALTPFLGPIALIIAKILIFGLLVTAAVGTIAYFIQLHQAKIRTHSTKYQQREETEEFTTMLKYHEEAVESSEKLRRQNLITQECEKVLKSVTEYLEEEMMSKLQISSKSKILVYNACQRYNVTTDEFKEVLESTLKDSTSMRFIEETLKIHLEKMQHEIVGSMYLSKVKVLIYPIEDPSLLRNAKFHIHSAYSSTDSISPDEFWQTVIPSEFSTSEIPVRFNIKPNEEAVDEVFRFICMDAIDKLTIDFEEGLKQKSTAENTERKMAMNKFEHWKSHLTSTLKGTLHQMFSNLVHTPSKDALISYIKNCAKQIPKTDEQKEFEEKQLRKKQHLKENSLFIAANRKVRFIGRDVEEIFRVMWNQKSNLQLLKHMILFDHALPPSSVKIVIDAVFHVLTDINPSIGSLNVTLFDKTQKLLLYIRRNSSGLQKIDLNLHLINGGYYLGCIEDFNNQKTKVLQNSIFEMLQSLLKHSKYAENNVFKQNVVNNLRDFKSDDKNEVQWFVDKTELAYCNSIIVYDSNKITEFETFNENNG
uniref:SecA family profile domain-containing protein n=1 Tax=Panagrolaimus davidi TaxID=227884 RepID=A0A914P7U4_9BILA